MKGLTAFIVLTLVSSLTYSQNSGIYEDSIVFEPKSKWGDYIEFVKVIPKKPGSPISYEIGLGNVRNKTNEITYVVKVSGSGRGSWWEAVRVNSNPYKLLNGVNFAIDYNAGQNETKLRLRIIGASRSDTAVKVYLKVRSFSGNSEWKSLKQKGNEPARIKSSRLAWKTNPFSQYLCYQAVMPIKRKSLFLFKSEKAFKLEKNQALTVRNFG